MAQATTEVMIDMGDLVTVTEGRVVGNITVFNEIDQSIEALNAKLTNAVFDVSNAKGLKDAKSAAWECAKLRNEVERVRKDATRPLDALKKMLIDEERTRVSAVQAIEQPIKDVIDAEERRLAEVARVEAARVQKHIDGIAAIEDYGRLPYAATLAEIERRIYALQHTATDELAFDEYAAKATEAKEQALAALLQAKTYAAKVEELERANAELAAKVVLPDAPIVEASVEPAADAFAMKQSISDQIAYADKQIEEIKAILAEHDSCPFNDPELTIKLIRAVLA